MRWALYVSTIDSGQAVVAVGATDDRVFCQVNAPWSRIVYSWKFMDMEIEHEVLNLSGSR